MVSQQEEEILKMENYLRKFGYIVPEIFEKKKNENSKNLNEINYAPDMKASMLDADQKNPYSNELLMTPELSDVGKFALQGKRLPILEILTANSGKGYDTTVTVNSSPTCTKLLTYEATPTGSGVKNIQNWLAGVYAEANYTITPNVTTERPVKSIRERGFQQTERSEFSRPNSCGLLGNRNRLTQKSRLESFDYKYEACDSETENIEDFEQKSYILPKENYSKRFTPEEPILPSIRNSHIKKDYSTPEEPIFNSESYSTGPIGPNSNSHTFIKDSCTERLTPDEPLLTVTRNLSTKKVYPTPEEPVISSFRNIAIEGEDYYTPEEPFKNCGRELYYTANRNTSQLLSTPKSPQLSDVTQKIMNIRNLRFSTSGSDSSLPEKNQSSIAVNNRKNALGIQFQRD